MFEKGKSGNPSGRPKLPEDIKAARVMAYEDMIRAVIGIRAMKPDEVKTVVEEGTCNMGERAIIKAYVENDTRAIQGYEDRLFGKAKETIELTGADGGDLFNPLRTKTDAELLAMLTIATTGRDG